MQNTINQRKEYAKISLWIVIIWLGFIASIVSANGMSSYLFRFSTSNIIIAVLDTSLDQYSYPCYLVAKYLFDPLESKF